MPLVGSIAVSLWHYKRDRDSNIRICDMMWTTAHFYYDIDLSYCGWNKVELNRTDLGRTSLVVFCSPPGWEWGREDCSRRPHSSPGHLPGGGWCEAGSWHYSALRWEKEGYNKVTVQCWPVATWTCQHQHHQHQHGREHDVSAGRHSLDECGHNQLTNSPPDL